MISISIYTFLPAGGQFQYQCHVTNRLHNTPVGMTQSLTVSTTQKKSAFPQPPWLSNRNEFATDL